MKPLMRWTIGKTTKKGYESLILSINSFIKHYDVEVVVCHNCPKENLPTSVLQFPLIDQTKHLNIGPEPKGVAWKLYPPRLTIDRHELSVDNDLIINEPIQQIEEFLSSDSTLLLEDKSRTYGRFESHVPAGFMINSGLYGMPPNFQLEPYVRFYAGKAWEKNAINQHDKNETFDEQGLIALALLNHSRYLIIDNRTITNCEHHLVDGKGHHFIGLNRVKHHSAFALYQSLKQKIHL
jgi:hypothetical protein